ncbi:hypothetical protein [Saccharothrix ecbatanensis]|uniref:hypothetical protein n=1 Tax=Saccharothrix ecbatanensis TaxID=1105145 RepID=UPI0035E44EE0
MARGVGTAEACRVVGVSRRTGHRWRNAPPSRAGAHRTTRLCPTRAAARPVVTAVRHRPRNGSRSPRTPDRLLAPQGSPPRGPLL